MEDKTESPHVDSSSFLTIIITVVIFVLTLVFFLYSYVKKSSKRGVLLTGLCDSGKTLLFSQLAHGKYVDTQTSMKENTGEFVTNKGVLQLIDIPGYERLRGKFIDQYKSAACGVMYIVDSVTIQKDIKDAAEFLYNILSDPEILRHIQSLLIVCNKQDLPLAKTTAVVKSLLEKELNALRITKSSQLQSVDEKGSKKIFLGKEGKDFSFSSLTIKVDVVEASALGEPTERTDIQKWLLSLC